MSLRLSRANLEKAVAAFLIEELAAIEALPAYPAGTELSSVPVHIRMGETDNEGKFKLNKLDEIPCPAICVAASRAERHPFGYAKCELHIIVLGSVDPVELPEGSDPPIGGSIITEGSTDFNNAKHQHETIVGHVAEIFSEANMADNLERMNPPASGPDTRGFKDFLGFGYLATDDSSQETERHWIDDFVLEFHCQPTTDTSL